MAVKNNETKKGRYFCLQGYYYCYMALIVSATLCFLADSLYTNGSSFGTYRSIGTALDQSFKYIANLSNGTKKPFHENTALKRNRKQPMTGYADRAVTNASSFTREGLNVLVKGEICTADFKQRHLLQLLHGQIRTGNLLFQFACLIATAKRICYTPIRQPQFLRHFDTYFYLRNVVEKSVDKFSFKTLHGPGWSIYDTNLTSKLKPDFNWTLQGLRQSFRYFKDESQLIRSSFIFKSPIKNDVNKYLTDESLYGQQTVCLHVRRGDFLKEQKKGYTASGLPYIHRAFQYMKMSLQRTQFHLIVLSDDMEWCKANIKGATVHYSPFEDPGRDLYLLTQCDHHIITSGTFGWMGAWLNETGVVCYDRFYPAPHSYIAKKHDSCDYYPCHWVGL